MQHDIYSWQVEGPKIKSIAEVTNQSEMVNGVVRSWLKSTSPEQRKNFIDIIFQILNTTNAHSVHELSIRNLGKIMDTYNNMGDKEKKEIKDILKILFKTSFNTIKNELSINFNNSIYNNWIFLRVPFAVMSEDFNIKFVCGFCCLFLLIN